MYDADPYGSYGFGSPPPPPPTMTSTTIRRAIFMHRQQPLEGYYSFLAPEDHEIKNNLQMSYALCKNLGLTRQAARSLC